MEADVYSCLSLVSSVRLVLEGSILLKEPLRRVHPCPGSCYSSGLKKPPLFLMSLIQTSVVSQHLLSLSVSLLLGSVIFLFPFLERKVKIEQFRSPEPNGFPSLMPCSHLSFLNSRVSCILMSSLQENEHLDDPSII